MPPPKGKHGNFEARLVAAIDRYLYRHAEALGWSESQGMDACDLLVGRVDSGEAGIRFSLPDDPDQVRGLDAYYLTPEQVVRRNATGSDEYIPEVPALVAEVISASESAAYIDEQVRTIWPAAPRWSGSCSPKLGRPRSIARASPFCP